MHDVMHFRAVWNVGIFLREQEDKRKQDTFNSHYNDAWHICGCSIIWPSYLNVSKLDCYSLTVGKDKLVGNSWQLYKLADNTWTCLSNSISMSIQQTVSSLVYKNTIFHSMCQHGVLVLYFLSNVTHVYVPRHSQMTWLPFFRRVRKIAKSDKPRHVCPSACPHGTTGLSLDGF